MTKILLTGSTGFIGSHLVKQISDKHQVVCLVSSSDLGRINTPTKVEIKFADLVDYQRVRKVVEDVSPNVIIHLAAITPVRHSFEQPEIYQEVNYFATVNLVHAAMKIPNFEKFIFASTMETYGWQPQRKPFTENLQLNPASPYAVSKVAAENYIKMAGKAFGFPHVIAKCCNTYGRKDSTGFIVEYLVTKMLKGETPYVGTPDAVRDLMYVDDHVNAYVKALDFDLGSKSEQKKNLDSDINYYTFNFGNSLQLTINEVAQKIKSMTGFSGNIVGSFPEDYPSRPVVEPYLSIDASKVKNILGWSPTTSLDDGLKKTIDYWKTAIKF